MKIFRVFALIGLTALFFVIAYPRRLHAFDTGSWIDRIQLHGFASQGYLSSDQNNYYADTEEGSFEFNEFGLTVLANPIDRITVGLQILSRDLGDISNNELDIDWAYGTYRWRDWFGISAGLLKVPWGFYNESRDIDLLRPWVFLPTSLYNERLRDAYSSYTGISIGGDILTDRFGSATYSIGYGEKVLSNDSTAYIMDINQENVFQNIQNKAHDLLLSKFDWETPIPGMRIGASFLTCLLDLTAETNSHQGWIENDVPPGTPIIDNSGRLSAIVLSAEYTLGGLTVAAEYLNEREYDLVAYNPYTGNRVNGSEQHSEGYYASLAYRFTPWLQCGIYYSVHYPDSDDKDGDELVENGEPAYNAWQKEAVLTARFDITEQWLVKFEGHAINGTADIPEFANPDGLSEDSFLFAIKTTFSF